MSDQSDSNASLSFGDGNDFSGSQVSTGDIAGRDVIKHYHASAERPVPAVSPPVADFIGRDEERRELGAVLRAGGAAVIRGMGGLGKTQLALQLAADVRRDFPDGQLLIELRGGSPERRSPEDALRTVLWSLRGPAERLPDELPGLVALYRATLGGRRLLVLVDDAPDSASARHFVPPAPCALLVTSRERITLDVQTRPLDLAALSDAQSCDLLLHLARRLEGDPRLPDLLRRCANLPLALRIAGDTLRERPDLPAARYLARLADETRRLGALRHEDRDVYAIIGFSDTLLAERNPALAGRWRMLHVCPAPFDREVVAALWDEQDEDALDDAIGELLRRSLLDYDEATGRYNQHDFLRDIARQRCPEPAAEAAHERHARYFCELANVANGLYKQGGDNVLHGLALFDANLAHIVAGQDWTAGRLGAERLAINYAVHTSSVLSLRLHPRTQIVWMETARAAALVNDDKKSEGKALGNLGNAYINLGDPIRSIGFYEQVIEIAQAINDRLGEGIALGGLGIAYRKLGQYARAIGFYEQQLEIARAIGNLRVEGNALGNLGVAYKNLRWFAQAIGYYELQLDIVQAIGDRDGEGTALGNLGNAYAALDKIERAFSCYEQQLIIAQASGNRRCEGNALGNLGNAYRNLGEVGQAIAYYEQNLEIARTIGDRAGEVRVCWNLGLVRELQGDYVQAAELMQRLVDYEREIGHPAAEQHAARVEEVRRKAQADAGEQS